MRFVKLLTRIGAVNIKDRLALPCPRLNYYV
jgi:hypothetical protein